MHAQIYFLTQIISLSRSLEKHVELSQDRNNVRAVHGNNDGNNSANPIRAAEISKDEEVANPIKVSEEESNQKTPNTSPKSFKEVVNSGV